MKQTSIKFSKNKSKMVQIEVEFLRNTVSEGKIYPKKT